MCNFFSKSEQCLNTVAKIVPIFHGDNFSTGLRVLITVKIQTKSNLGTISDGCFLALLKVNVLQITNDV